MCVSLSVCTYVSMSTRELCAHKSHWMCVCVNTVGQRLGISLESEAPLDRGGVFVGSGMEDLGKGGSRRKWRDRGRRQ